MVPKASAPPAPAPAAAPGSDGNGPSTSSRGPLTIPQQEPHALGKRVQGAPLLSRTRARRSPGVSEPRPVGSTGRKELQWHPRPGSWESGRPLLLAVFLPSWPPPARVRGNSRQGKPFPGRQSPQIASRTESRCSISGKIVQK